MSSSLPSASQASTSSALHKFSIGLTGGIGSGKTTIADFFAELGASVVDTDVIAHRLTMPGGRAISAIQDAFGADFIATDGAMDRQKMREHVFQDPIAKKSLESILHPLIRSECEETALTSQGPYVIFVVPLLIESGSWANRVNKILVVDCAEETQITRVMRRNHFRREQVLDIMRAQVTREIRLKHADDVINSEQDLIQVKQQVEVLHQKYLKLGDLT